MRGPGKVFSHPEKPTRLQRLLQPRRSAKARQDHAESEALVLQRAKESTNRAQVKQALRNFRDGNLADAIQIVDALPEAKPEIKGNWNAEQLMGFLGEGLGPTKRLRRYNTDLAFASAQQEGNLITTRYAHGNGEATVIRMEAEQFWKGYEMYLDAASIDRLVGTSLPASYRIDIETLLKKQAAPQGEETRRYVLPELIERTVRPQDRLDYYTHYVDGHRNDRKVDPADFVGFMESLPVKLTANVQTAEFLESSGHTPRVKLDLTNAVDVDYGDSHRDGHVRPAEEKLYMLALAAKRDGNNVVLNYPTEVDGNEVISWQLTIPVETYNDLMKELQRRHPKLEAVLANFQKALGGLPEYAVNDLPKPTHLDSAFITVNHPAEDSPLITKQLE